MICLYFNVKSVSLKYTWRKNLIDLFSLYISKHQWYFSMFSAYWVLYRHRHSYNEKIKPFIIKWWDKLKGKWWKYIEKHAVSYVGFAVFADWHFELWLGKLHSVFYNYMCWCFIGWQVGWYISMGPFEWILLSLFNGISQWQFQIYYLQPKPRTRSYCGTMTFFLFPCIFISLLNRSNCD